MLRPEDILNVSIQSQEAILSSSNNDPTEDENPGPCTLELDKDALIDRIQQQQLRERVGSIPNRLGMNIFHIIENINEVLGIFHLGLILLP